MMTSEQRNSFRAAIGTAEDVMDLIQISDEVAEAGDPDWSLMVFAQAVRAARGIDDKAMVLSMGALSGRLGTADREKLVAYMTKRRDLVERMVAVDVLCEVGEYDAAFGLARSMAKRGRDIVGLTDMAQHVNNASVPKAKALVHDLMARAESMAKDWTDLSTVVDAWCKLDCPKEALAMARRSDSLAESDDEHLAIAELLTAVAPEEAIKRALDLSEHTDDGFVFAQCMELLFKVGRADLVRPRVGRILRLNEDAYGVLSLAKKVMAAGDLDLAQTLIEDASARVADSFEAEEVGAAQIALSERLRSSP